MYSFCVLWFQGINIYAFSYFFIKYVVFTLIWHQNMISANIFILLNLCVASVKAMPPPFVTFSTIFDLGPPNFYGVL